MAEESPELVHPAIQKRHPENVLIKEAWEREVDGVHRAMHFVHQKARGVSDGGLSREDILKIHKFVMNDPFNPEKTGVLRRVPVVVRGRINGEVKEAAFEPADVYFLSEYFNEFATELEENTSGLSSEAPIKDVIDMAARAHMRFIEIHPFENGNGRTARLLVDFIFRKARLPYIRDWGAQKHKYDEVVYKIYEENDPELLKGFLGRKMLKAIEDRISKSEGANSQGLLLGYLKNRKSETEEFLRSMPRSNMVVAEKI